MEALVDCSLEVMEGEFIVVRGPSGSGKTTMLMTLGGMLHPSTGRVVVQGESIWERSEAWRAGFRANTIGFVFQDFHLLPYLTVRENIELAACTSGSRGHDVDDQLERAWAPGPVRSPSR